MVANNSVYVMSCPLWLTYNFDELDFDDGDGDGDDDDDDDDEGGGDGGDEDGQQLRVRHVMTTLSHL